MSEPNITKGIQVMKKPSKKPQEIASEASSLIDTDSGEYTPDDFENIAKEMRELDILKISFGGGWDDTNVYMHELESEEEALIRYNKEMKQYNKHKERELKKKQKHLDNVRKQAIKLGLIEGE